MTKINIFLENTYQDYQIEDKKIYDNTIKIANYLFEQKEVLQNSCLNDIEYQEIFFDVVLMNNEEIHRINKEYRQKDMPTDVITFAIFADSSEDEKFVFDGEVHLGEIMISLDKIEEQAKENNVTFEDELYYLVSHGILHLLGYDHQNEEDYNYMVKVQNQAKAIVNE